MKVALTRIAVTTAGGVIAAATAAAGAGKHWNCISTVTTVLSLHDYYFVHVCTQ